MKTNQAFCVLAAMAGVTAAWAGWFSSGPEQDPSAKLGTIFGNTTGFTAQSQMTVTDKKGREVYAGETGYAYLDGKVRAEIDLTKTRSVQKRAGEMEGLQEMGMDVMVHITRPDKNVTYVVYPSLKAYCEMPIVKKASGDAVKPPKIERIVLGQETLDGHPCTKNKVVVTDDKGQQQEFFVWEATDLKNFAIQTEYREGDNIVKLHFTKIDLTKPSPALFEPPAGSTKYASVQEMMMGQMKQMMKGMGGD